MASTLTLEDSLDDVLDEVKYTQKYLSKTGYFASHLVIFEGLAQQGKTLRAKADSLHEDVFEAEIEVLLCDAKLNAKCAEVIARLKDMKNEHEQAHLRARLIGNKAPSVFIRPILGGQLKSMKPWPPILAQVPFEPLKTLGPSVQAVVDEGSAAEGNLEAKEQAEDQFYFVGDYKKYLEQVNAARTLLEGEAEAFRHSHPELNLPKNFAAMPFMPREREKNLSASQLVKRLASAEALVAKLKAEQKARLDEANAEEEARKEAELKAKLAAIAQKEKEAAQIAEQLAALKAELK